jgi:hypothetical protein
MTGPSIQFSPLIPTTRAQSDNAKRSPFTTRKQSMLRIVLVCSSCSFLRLRGLTLSPLIPSLANVIALFNHIILQKRARTRRPNASTADTRTRLTVRGVCVRPAWVARFASATLSQSVGRHARACTHAQQYRCSVWWCAQCRRRL